MRLLIVRRNCPYCLEWTKVVNKINLKLPFDKRIRIIDNYEWDEFGINFHPVTDKFGEDVFHSYPFCYLDGILVGKADKKIAQSFLSRYLKDEFILK